MKSTLKIIQLTSNKDRKVTLMFNDELWELFKECCNSENSKITKKLETLIINYLDEKGKL